VREICICIGVVCGGKLREVGSGGALVEAFMLHLQIGAVIVLLLGERVLQGVAALGEEALEALS